MLAVLHPNMRDPFRTERRLTSPRSRHASSENNASKPASKDGAAAVPGTTAKRASTRQTRKSATKAATTLPGSGAGFSASATPAGLGANLSSPTNKPSFPVSVPSPTSSVESVDPAWLHVSSPDHTSHTKTANVKSFFSSFANRISPLFSLPSNTSRRARRSASPAKQSDSALDSHNHAEVMFSVSDTFSARDSDGRVPDASDFMDTHRVPVGLFLEPEAATVPRGIPDIDLSYVKTPEYDDNFVPSTLPISASVLLQRQDYATEYIDFSHDFVQPDYSYQSVFMLEQSSYFSHHVHSAIDLGDQHELVTVLQRQGEPLKHESYDEQQPSRKRSDEVFPKHLGLHENSPLPKTISLDEFHNQMNIRGLQSARKRSHEDFILDDDQVTLTDARDRELRRVASAQTLTAARDRDIRRATSSQMLTARASAETLIGDINPESSRSSPSRPMERLASASASSTSSPRCPQGRPAKNDDPTHIVHEVCTHMEAVARVDIPSIPALPRHPQPCVPAMYTNAFIMQPAGLEYSTFDAAATMPPLHSPYSHSPITPPARKSSPAAVFINFTEEDKETINNAVAPSGSSKSSKSKRKSQDSKKEKGNR
ncbi:hypothetical protein V1517DRAFT_207576 [Lipomyces orientalis]|uniref:Uncharacterized protein n=1 Tax=Lipomyces orientalis TaxID=1233043 RepID=A0ACC3TH69_9ASCO